MTGRRPQVGHDKSSEFGADILGTLSGTNPPYGARAWMASVEGTLWCHSAVLCVRLDTE